MIIRGGGMTQQVQVVNVAGDRVEVSAGVMQTIFGDRERKYWAENDLAVQRGKWVEVSLSSQRMLLEVLLLLGLPIILTFTIYFFSAHWFAGTMVETSRVIASLVGLPLGFLIYKGLVTLLPKAVPRVTRVLDEDPEIGQGCGNGCLCRRNSVRPAKIDDSTD